MNVLYGSIAGGLSPDVTLPDQFWHQDSADIEDGVESQDAFGYALAAGDFNADGAVDLAIGVPSEGVSDLDETGAVNVIYGSAPAGLSPTASLPDQFWNQDSP